MTKRYSVSMGENNKVITELDLDKISGLSLKPKNKIEVSLKVTEAKIINPVFIENIYMKKNEKKLEYFLRYLMTLMSDDESGSEDVALALDELERFRRQIINKQRIYLEKQYIKKMIERINIIEEELKRKVVYLGPIEEKRRKGR